MSQPIAIPELEHLITNGHYELAFTKPQELEIDELVESGHALTVSISSSPPYQSQNRVSLTGSKMRP